MSRENCNVRDYDAIMCNKKHIHTKRTKVERENHIRSAEFIIRTHRCRMCALFTENYIAFFDPNSSSQE